MIHAPYTLSITELSSEFTFKIKVLTEGLEFILFVFKVFDQDSITAPKYF
jgi:hypothetical protein